MYSRQTQKWCSPHFLRVGQYQEIIQEKSCTSGVQTILHSRAVIQGMLEAWHLMSARCSAITLRHFANGLQTAKNNFPNVYSCIKKVWKCHRQSVYPVASCIKVMTFILILIILSLQEVPVLESHLQKTALVKLPVKDVPPRTASHLETRWLTAGRMPQCCWMGLSHSVQLCHTTWTSSSLYLTFWTSKVAFKKTASQ